MSSPDPKVWLITGASRGLGIALATEALARGDMVIGTARNPLILPDSLKDHPNFFGLSLDVVYEGDTHGAARAAAGKFGRIDVLVNNAAFGLLGAVEETSAEEVQSVYDANVFGLLHMTRSVLPYMRRQKSGHIINMSSVGGITAFPGWGVYCSSKFAVEGLTEALAVELKPFGISATTVEIGFFRSDFLSAQSLVHTQKRLTDYEETIDPVREFATRADQKQPGDPVKLARVLLKLADHPNPPVHLPLGSDAVARLKAKMATVQQEMEEWMAISTDTDHDDLTGSVDHSQLAP